jgi:hypothetical protein
MERRHKAIVRYDVTVHDDSNCDHTAEVRHELEQDWLAQRGRL